MKKLTKGAVIELHECRQTLHLVLESLDHVGAGVAAVHIDAAIHNLDSHLDCADLPVRFEDEADVTKLALYGYTLQ